MVDLDRLRMVGGQIQCLVAGGLVLSFDHQTLQVYDERVMKLI